MSDDFRLSTVMQHNSQTKAHVPTRMGGDRQPPHVLPLIVVDDMPQ